MVVSSLLCVAAGLSCAVALEPIAITPELHTVDVERFCEFTRADPRTQRHEIVGTATSTWRACEHGSLAGGLSGRALWVRFKLENASTQARLVYVEQPIPWVDEVQIWLRYADGKEQTLRAGKLARYDDRPVPAMNFFFPVALEAGLEADVVMRLRSIGSNSVALRLHSSEAFEARRDAHNLFVGFLAGGVVLILLYNFFLYTALRDIKYVVYVTYGVCVLLFCGALYGFNYPLLWPASPELDLMVASSSPSLALAFVLVFMQLFFDLRNNARPVFRILNALIGMLVLAACAQVFGAIPELAPSLNALASTLALFGVLTVVVWAYQRGLPGAGYVLVGWLLSLLGFFAIAFFAHGLIAFSYTMYYGAGTGFLLELALFSFALAGRIEQLRSERETARAASVDAQIQLTRSLSRANAELEHSVKVRTAELEQARAEAEHLALTDGLTGMRNRRALFEHALQLHAEALRSKAPYSAIMMDIDHFKRINDQYGHQMGDDTLRAVAEVIGQVVRDADIAGRIGGEEFAILLPHTDAERAQVLADRLRAAVAQLRIPAGSDQIKLTSSFGVTESADDDNDFDAVLERADKALYEAKALGRDRVVSTVSATL